MSEREISWDELKARKMDKAEKAFLLAIHRHRPNVTLREIDGELHLIGIRLKTAVEMGR